MPLKYYLDTKKIRSKERAIFGYYHSKDRQFAISTGKKIEPKYWNKKEKRPIANGKGKYIGAPELITYLNNLSERVDRYILEIENRDPEASFEKKKKYVLQRINKKDGNFFDVFESYLNVKENEVSKSTIRKYKVIKNHLLSFQTRQKHNLSFEGMNNEFRDDFFSYLLNDKKMLDSTSYKVIKFVKGFLSWAADRKYHSNFDFRTWKGKDFINEIITLTQEELDKIRNLEIEDKKLDRVRDLFLFQCNTGVRFSDLKKIKREDIKIDGWHVRTEKTNDPLVIPLSPDALEILDKNKNYPKTLPVISNQKCNDYLKDLCRLAEVNEPTTISRSRKNKKEERTVEKWKLIGSHTARRTFITLSLERGMRPEVLMKITGHKSYRTMQKYVNITNKIVRNEFQKAWGAPLRLVKNSE